jgi:hypothetical protein
MLDAFSRRHEGQKIYLRQLAAQRWIGWRDQVLQGGRPHTGNTEQLEACDAQLRVVCQTPPFTCIVRLILAFQELAAITDDTIYSDLRSSDYQMGRWTHEDPPLRHVQRWVRARR